MKHRVEDDGRALSEKTEQMRAKMDFQVSVRLYSLFLLFCICIDIRAIFAWGFVISIAFIRQESIFVSDSMQVDERVREALEEYNTREQTLTREISDLR